MEVEYHTAMDSRAQDELTEDAAVKASWRELGEEAEYECQGGRRAVGTSHYLIPPHPYLIPEVILPAISFEHASLSVNHLRLQKGRVAFCINFPNLAVNTLTLNTYFAPQSFPRSGGDQILEMGNWRSVRFAALIPEHTKARPPGQGDMAGVDVEPRCNNRAVRLYWSFLFDAVDKNF